MLIDNWMEKLYCRQIGRHTSKHGVVHSDKQISSCLRRQTGNCTMCETRDRNAECANRQADRFSRQVWRCANTQASGWADTHKQTERRANLEMKKQTHRQVSKQAQ